MKFRISILLFSLALATASVASARPNACSMETIRGSYAFTIHGQIFTPGGLLLVNGIARTTFDGNGNLTQVDAVAINGNTPPGWRPGTGTYNLNPDCTGTMVLINQNQAPLHLSILVSRSGEIIHTVVTDPGFAVTSDAERISVLRWDD